MAKNFLKYSLTALLIISLSGCDKPAPKGHPVTLKTLKFLNLNNSVGVNSEFNTHFNNGVTLAVNEINKNGGVAGRLIEVVNKEVNNNYLESEKAVYDIANSNTMAVFGTYFTTSAEGAAKAAGTYKVPFLAASAYTDSIIYNYPNNYTYRLRPGLEASLNALTLKVKDIVNLNRWMVITYSNAEGAYVTKTFEKVLLKEKSLTNPFSQDNKVKKSGLFFLTHNVAPFKAAEFLSIDKTLKADLSLVKAVLIAVNGNDVQNLIDNNNLAEQFAGKKVFILFAGEPEWLSYTSENKTPEGWLTTGYPWYSIDLASHDNFYWQYYNTYKLQPRYASLLGYISVYMLAEAAKNTNFNLNTIENLREDFNSHLLTAKLKNTPLGEIAMRADRQTNMGVYTGALKIFKKRIGEMNNKPVELADIRMNDITYYPGNDLLPPPALVLKVNAKKRALRKKYQKMMHLSFNPKPN